MVPIIGQRLIQNESTGNGDRESGQIFIRRDDQTFRGRQDSFRDWPADRQPAGSDKTGGHNGLLQYPA